jgi:hypothetical protein
MDGFGLRLGGLSSLSSPKSMSTEDRLALLDVFAFDFWGTVSSSSSKSIDMSASSSSRELIGAAFLAGGGDREGERDGEREYE